MGEGIAVRARVAPALTGRVDSTGFARDLTASPFAKYLVGGGLRRNSPWIIHGQGKGAKIAHWAESVFKA
jgi:hypothetical protein